MICFETITDKIVLLTQQVEQLLDSEDEENCASLLVERQQLLVELAQFVESALNVGDADSTNIDSDYRSFLQAIQRRDQETLQQVYTTKAKLVNDLKHQLKGSKAVSVYKSIEIE